MNYDTLLHYIGHFGYAALFFALWLGIIGMPIPDEVIVMTGGAVVKTGLLHAVPAFMVTYLGVISGLSLGYVLGRYFGSPVLDKLRRKKNVEKHIQTSERLIQRYGNFALCFSYFLPIVRHIVPYLVGINKMPYRRYILYSYTTGFVWTFLFFVIGQFAGSRVESMGIMLYHYGLYIGLSLLIIAIAVVCLKLRRSN